MNFSKKILLFCLIVSFTTHFTIGQTNEKRRYTTIAISSEDAPVIDGNLNDLIWNEAQWGTDFIEVFPDENTPPSVQTQFKIIYDDKYIYVAINALDPEPETITKRLTRRDGFEGDRINVVFDSYHDQRTGFILTVTAAGVRGDEFVSDNGDDIDDSWNPIWSTKTQINTDGWSAEMKIPFSQLRFGNDDTQVWGFNVGRQYFKNNEYSIWDRLPVGSPGWISEAGELHGIKNIKPQRQLEIQPFKVTQLETYKREQDNPYKNSGTDFNFNAGLDAKIGITNDLTLDVTVNPDFGQVEADPAAIALDGFEIFNREQRPFFIENKNIFDYRFGRQDNLFFSRRIGRSAQVYPDLPDDSYTERPNNTTILGAAKFSGKTKKGWSVGLLESVTSKEYVEISTNGNTSTQIIEPFTNYLVGRVQKDFNERNTFLGGMFTATNRNNTPETSELRTAAYTGGVDFKHQWKDRAYFLESYLLMSHVKGSEEAIQKTQESITHLFHRADATHVEVDPTRTSLTGTGGLFRIGKVGGTNWNYNGGVKWISPELELNDVGFLRSADQIFQFANLRYQTAKPVGVFRRIGGGLRQFSSFDFEGNHNRNQFEINANANFINNWSVRIGATHKPKIFLNTTLQGGPRWRFSEENFGYVYIESDDRKNLSGSINIVNSQAAENNFSFFKLSGEIRYQPLDALNLSFAPEFESRPNKTQYVTQEDYSGTKRYILGTIDNQTLSAAIRINYTLNPNLTIQYYAQPFISRGRYSEFKYVTNATASRLDDRFQLYSSDQIKRRDEDYSIDDNLDGIEDYRFGNPDFSVVQFNSNLVLRWEYIPGSEVFLVWSQGVRTSVGIDQDLTDGLGSGILGQQPQNIFLIKATYRFVL